MFALQDAINAAAEIGPDMNEAQAGGIEFELPAEGPVRLRFVGYIELGKHRDESFKKDKELVQLIFELSGPKHPPREFDGKRYPQLIQFETTLSLNEKSSFYKLFKRMNYTGEAKHMAQLLGKPYMGTVVHKTVGEGDKKRTYANLRGADGYTIRPPFFETMDEATGEMVSKPVPVDEAISSMRCFIWTSPVQLKEMWDSLFIDGRFDDRKDDKTGETIPGRSKNRFQEKVKSALNYAGSPIAELLMAGGEPDLSAAGDVERPERAPENVGGAAGDPLNGVA